MRRALLLAHFLDALHGFGMARPLDARFLRCAVEFWMEIVASLAVVLFRFHWGSVCIGPCVLTDASHLPGDLHARLVGLYAELMIGYFAGNNGLRLDDIEKGGAQ